MFARTVACLSLALALAGCATDYGDPADGFMNAAIEAAFIPLGGSGGMFTSLHGAGVVLAPGVAVTNAHNDSMVPPARVIGRPRDSDLLFFRVEHGTPLPTGRPHEGEQIVAYGSGADGALRVAYGTVRKARVPVVPFCKGCAMQEAFLFESNAGPGFSGGPVLDLQTGQLIGITFGFLEDTEVPDRAAVGVQGTGVEGTRAMYAYDIAHVEAAFSAFRNAAQPGSN